MNSNPDNSTLSDQEWEEAAAQFAVGALDPGEHHDFERRLAGAGEDESRAVAAWFDLAALIASVSSRNLEVRPELTKRLLARIRRFARGKATGVRGERAGLSFLKSAAKDGWMSLPVPGASARILAVNEPEGYAVVLGRLEAGASYPPHPHHGPEEVYMLSGDLSIGEERLLPGDFHRAEAGSWHEANHSEQGCTLLVVLSVVDLQAQMAT